MANILINKYRVHLFYRRVGFLVGSDFFEMTLENILVMFNDATIESILNNTNILVMVLVLNIKEDYEKEVMYNKLIALGYIKE
ncbi:MAG: hypothetical protein [Bacteriophage sp.]|nr:MAG: hypothetical protein [Bacteriophage sp.]